MRSHFDTTYTLYEQYARHETQRQPRVVAVAIERGFA